MPPANSVCADRSLGDLLEETAQFASAAAEERFRGAAAAGLSVATARIEARVLAARGVLAARVAEGRRRARALRTSVWASAAAALTSEGPFGERSLLARVAGRFLGLWVCLGLMVWAAYSGATGLLPERGDTRYLLLKNTRPLTMKLRTRGCNVWFATEKGVLSDPGRAPGQLWDDIRGAFDIEGRFGLWDREASPFVASSGMPGLEVRLDEDDGILHVGVFKEESGFEEDLSRFYGDLGDGDDRRPWCNLAIRAVSETTLDVELVGPAKVHLFASSSAADQREAPRIEIIGQETGSFVFFEAGGGSVFDRIHVNATLGGVQLRDVTARDVEVHFRDAGFTDIATRQSIGTLSSRKHSQVCMVGGDRFMGIQVTLPTTSYLGQFHNLLAFSRNRSVGLMHVKTTGPGPVALTAGWVPALLDDEKFGLTALDILRLPRDAAIRKMREVNPPVYVQRPVDISTFIRNGERSRFPIFFPLAPGNVKGRPQWQFAEVGYNGFPPYVLSLLSFGLLAPTSSVQYQYPMTAPCPAVRPHNLTCTQLGNTTGNFSAALTSPDGSDPVLNASGLIDDVDTTSGTAFFSRQQAFTCSNTSDLAPRAEEDIHKEIIADLHDLASPSFQNPRRRLAVQRALGDSGVLEVIRNNATGSARLAVRTPFTDLVHALLVIFSVLTAAAAAAWLVWLLWTLADNTRTLLVAESLFRDPVFFREFARLRRHTARHLAEHLKRAAAAARASTTDSTAGARENALPSSADVDAREAHDTIIAEIMDKEDIMSHRGSPVTSRHMVMPLWKLRLFHFKEAYVKGGHPDVARSAGVVLHRLEVIGDTMLPAFLFSFVRVCMKRRGAQYDGPGSGAGENSKEGAIRSNHTLRWFSHQVFFPSWAHIALDSVLWSVFFGALLFVATFPLAAVSAGMRAYRDQYDHPPPVISSFTFWSRIVIGVLVAGSISLNFLGSASHRKFVGTLQRQPSSNAAASASRSRVSAQAPKRGNAAGVAVRVRGGRAEVPSLADTCRKISFLTRARDGLWCLLPQFFEVTLVLCIGIAAMILSTFAIWTLLGMFVEPERAAPFLSGGVGLIAHMLTRWRSLKASLDSIIAEVGEGMFELDRFMEVTKQARTMFANTPVGRGLHALERCLQDGARLRDRLESIAGEIDAGVQSLPAQLSGKFAQALEVMMLNARKKLDHIVSRAADMSDFVSIPDAIPAPAHLAPSRAEVTRPSPLPPLVAAVANDAPAPGRAHPVEHPTGDDSDEDSDADQQDHDKPTVEGGGDGQGFVDDDGPASAHPIESADPGAPPDPHSEVSGMGDWPRDDKGTIRFGAALRMLEAHYRDLPDRVLRDVIMGEQESLLEALKMPLLVDSSGHVRGVARGLLRTQRRAREAIVGFLTENGFSEEQLVFLCAMSGFTLFCILAFILLGLYTFGNPDNTTESFIGVVLTSGASFGYHTQRVGTDLAERTATTRKLLDRYMRRVQSSSIIFSIHDPLEKVSDAFRQLHAEKLD